MPPPPALLPPSPINLAAPLLSMPCALSPSVDLNGWSDLVVASSTSVSTFLNQGMCEPGYAAGPPCMPCAPGSYSSDRGVGSCAVCPAKHTCPGATITPVLCGGVGYMCPPGQALASSSPASACFASASTVAAWTTNGTHDTLITQPGSPGVGAMVVAGLATGFDVPCNGPDAPARLPVGVSSVGLVSVALGPCGGALVLANGSVVAVGAGNATGHFVAQAGAPLGLPPSARYTTACVVDATGDGIVDVLLGAAAGSTSAALLGGDTGFSVSTGLGAALGTALGSAGVTGMVASTLGTGSPGGVSVIAAGPTGVLLIQLSPSGDAVVNVTAIPGGGGGVPGGIAAGYLVVGEGTLAVITCSTSASTNTTSLWLASNVGKPGVGFVTVNGTLPGPCSGVGLGDANGCVRVP
jgi:hypothetical protein